ncbi:hypothetical protein SCAR479_05621 [Seiridium cardinale]|uniref:Mid2 domain-containing protein n=1 Tax=Seiridium cardinale TaxID=138064 RepID=A0ABR2XUS2_9PEZI
MLFSHFSYALIWASGLATASASPSSSDISIHTRNAPGRSASDTLRALGRALQHASIQKRDNVFKNSTSIEKSWTDATLFKMEKTVKKGNATATGSIEFICTTCYVKTKATAQLTIDGTFNATAAFDNVSTPNEILFTEYVMWDKELWNRSAAGVTNDSSLQVTDQIGDQFENLTTTVVDYVDDYISNTMHKLADGIDASDFAVPPIDVDFHIDIPEVPETHLSFQFDDLELYVLLDTILAGGLTYNLNLYTSNTPIGISIGDDVKAGVILTINLIMTAEAEIDISSGFHIKLDDGVAFDIALFGQNVSDTTFNGGSFEFLPVTIQGAGVLSAVLRVGVSAGFDLKTEADSSLFDVSAGVMVGVFAHIAEFTTNVTASLDGNDDGCALHVEESYQLAIGAAAGATIALDDHTWGPVPATTVPVFYTTITDACAVTKTPTASATTKSADKRRDLTTTTLEHTDTYTGVECLSTGLVNCPASLQTTVITSSVKSLVTSVASGVTAVWPSSVLSSVPTTLPFGTAVRDLFATTGAPTSYSPTPTSISQDVSNFVNGVDKRIIIGVCVGVGGALILGIIGCCLLRHRRRKYAAVPTAPGPTIVVQTPAPYSAGFGEAKKTPASVSVSHY